jgi:trans-2,3-dihydro-3-hydroxyanthranilate isomerase
VPIQVTRRDGAPPFLQLTAARVPETRRSAPSRADVARALNLDENDVTGDAQAWSCGAPYLFLPVRDRAALARAAPNSAAWSKVFTGAWATDVYVFCSDPELPGSHLRARMFAPELGVTEDPATGSAAAAFAGYLVAQEPARTGTRKWVVEQGFEMGRPSLLHVEADTSEGKITAVRVGGTAVKMSEGTLLHS